jgi:hypothetical protein
VRANGLLRLMANDSRELGGREWLRVGLVYEMNGGLVGDGR